MKLRTPNIELSKFQTARPSMSVAPQTCRGGRHLMFPRLVWARRRITDKESIILRIPTGLLTTLRVEGIGQMPAPSPYHFALNQPPLDPKAQKFATCMTNLFKLTQSLQKPGLPMVSPTPRDTPNLDFGHDQRFCSIVWWSRLPLIPQITGNRACPYPSH